MTEGVTAVIPTIGRPELRRAVLSVRRQTVEVQPLIVLDRPDRLTEVEAMLSGLDARIITTSGRERGSAARNAGVRAAHGEVIAFLDDDDHWHPEKTARQLAALDSRPHALLACRARLIGQTARVIPERPPRRAETVGDYALRRATLRLRETFVQSSTLMCRRDRALASPWNTSLRRHEDWDFAMRMEREGASLIVLPDVLVDVQQDSAGSVSRSPDWRASRGWLEELPSELGRRSRADFRAAIIARGALASRAWAAGVGELARAALSGAHPAALVVGASGVREGGRRGG